MKGQQSWPITGDPQLGKRIRTRRRTVGCAPGSGEERSVAVPNTADGTPAAPVKYLDSALAYPQTW